MDAELSKRKYRQNVYVYDFVTQAFAGVRARAISKLHLKQGETVLDFGCGTGLSFELLEKYVGSAGHIIGVDQSVEMLGRAKQKIERYGWQNIQLVTANVAEVNLSTFVDAALCFYTHDISSSKVVMDKAVNALKDGGRFVSAGVKLRTGAFSRVLNALTQAYSQAGVTIPLTVQPWLTLESVLGTLCVEEYLMGTAYVAYGERKKNK